MKLTVKSKDGFLPLLSQGEHLGGMTNEEQEENEGKELTESQKL